MSREFIDTLCEKIEMPQDTVDAVNELLNSKERVVSSLASQIASADKMSLLLKEMKRYGSRSRLFALCVILTRCEKTHEFYSKNNIDDDIFYHTMSDITIWAENCRAKTGQMGVEEVLWLSNHLIPNIFRLGRLQFQMFRIIKPPYTKIMQRVKSPFHTGDKCIFVHIPQGESLTPEECTKSFEAAEVFFKEKFPKFKYDYYVTESWLIYPENRNFMGSDSNIVKFADRFNILSGAPIDKQAIERIWGKREKNIEDYIEDTSLQKSAKRYLTNGGRLGTAYGYIKK